MILCLLFGHKWREKDMSGHVHVGDDSLWDGERMKDGTPWVNIQIPVCTRCGKWA